MYWRNVYIFIRSTFNDMHAERDYLVKNVFPELAEWCEGRRLRLVDVDLRRGVTSADSMAKNTVLTCLRNIDECRPFFLCFLGQRRGWVPPPGEIGASTIGSYPDLPRYIEKTSVTEMEIEHALLSPMRRIVDEREDIPAPASHALFFVRNDGFTHLLTDSQRLIYTNAAEEDVASADHALNVFKQKVKSRWTNVTDYDCRWDERTITTELLTEGPGVSQGRLVDFFAEGRPLRDVVIDKLKTEIDREFQDHAIALAQSALEAGLEQQAHFIEQNRYGFISRSDDLKSLVEYIDGDHNGIFVLTAPAGLGKTMLLANFTYKLASEGHKVYPRFCGASDLTADIYSVWKASVVGRRVYLSLSDKNRSNRVSAWNLDTGDHIVSTDSLGQGVTETAETGRLLWGRVMEIISRRDFAVLWDTRTDEPLCRFCCDSRLHLYESGREMIGYRNGEAVRFALENWPAQM